MTDTPIGVTGATGEVGGRVARALADRGVPTRLVVRDADRAALRDSLYADVLSSLATDGLIRGPAGTGRLAPVARDDVADAAVAALLDPAHDGVIELTGPELHPVDDLTEIVTEATGAAVRYEAETRETLLTRSHDG